ncbi:COQ9 family protein [Mesobaculum littorinae]|uniref:COQ9 family protein n=2 Tax=Mesobaculum littorinae TaxID=2486419 RepID=A0A438AG34_9RHOB|nr:COQ9 family protein [Mesobaculum littorinae]
MGEGRIHVEPRDAILDAALMHVAFDGWSTATLIGAARDADVPLHEARALFPRGGVDLALAFHRRGDDRMADRLAAERLDDLRFRDRIARAVRIRLELVPDREAVRRAATLFALPVHAGDGARAVWQTADRIWTELGDTSTDANWYTKRATLSGVYGATLLFWLGDDSPGQRDTWDFLERRIDEVMKIETFKAQTRKNPVLKVLFAGPNWAMSRVKPPRRGPLPGRWPGSRAPQGAAPGSAAPGGRR